ncbi:peptidylprolyl isomerase [Actinomadura chokoriensis]|uniref:Peptidyl-prolyl cis-trans isomerase n=1 Tax=Actinomadura chokoriensis TaxID=454156 RepID=A0ABV4R4R4_9ACTN
MAGKDRKKQLARQRYERQEQRRAQEAAKARRLKVIGSVAAVAVVVAGVAAFMVFKKDESTAAGPRCVYEPETDGGEVKDVGTPPGEPAHTGIVQATVKTSQGDVEMQLYGDKAPCTVNSFVFLAQKNYFDKTECHRLTSGGLNVLQCGDPAASGRGGPGYRFTTENTAGATYTEGTLAMARSDSPDSNGSQFFMVYKDSQLKPEYTVFGKITKGLDVLGKIAKNGSNPAGDGKPKKKVEIQDVTIAGK